MPVRYPLSASAEGGEQRAAPRAASSHARGWGFWTVVSGTTALVLAGVAYLAVALATSTAPFSAGGLASYYPSGSFEAVSLSTGDLYFAHITARNGLVVLTDTYFVDPGSGKLIAGHPGSNPGNSLQTRATAGRYGPGSPVVIDPGQIVTVEPVDMYSAVGREIAAVEEAKSRQRGETPTTRVPGGFQ